MANEDRPELTLADWVEIYEALGDKLRSATVQGNDRIANEWRAHLRAIMDTIGPDGCNIW